MKNAKSIHIVLLAASLLLASNLSAHARSSQQSGDQAKPDPSPTKQPEQQNTSGAATSTKSNSNNSTASTAPPGTTSSPTTTSPRKSPVKNAGMVWVNTESGVYHKLGTHWYGKTKKGKYMLEVDAIKAGYKASGRN